VLLFLLWEVLSHTADPVEEALVDAAGGKESWATFALRAPVAILGLGIGLLGLAYCEGWMSARAHRRFGPGAMAVDECRTSAASTVGPLLPRSAVGDEGGRLVEPVYLIRREPRIGLPDRHRMIQSLQRAAANSAKKRSQQPLGRHRPRMRRIDGHLRENHRRQRDVEIRRSLRCVAPVDEHRPWRTEQYVVRVQVHVQHSRGGIGAQPRRQLVQPVMQIGQLGRSVGYPSVPAIRADAIVGPLTRSMTRSAPSAR
jgi:hypothetical protein